MTSTDTTIAAPDRSPPAEPVTTSTPSLKTRALHGSMWTAFNFASSQGLRLGSNLILTRLLVPEAFGTVLLINVVIQGLHMFSDTGIGPSIIHNKRGDDPAFLNTAWTIQIFRGCALWLVCLLLAWPLSMFYEDAVLMWLLPVAGLTALAEGFVSTGPCTFHRHLRLGRLTAYELSGQFTTIGVTIVLAVLWPTVWALVLGPVVGSAVRLLLSHTTFREIRNRFRWDRDAARHFVRFGRWIFISTALTFVVTQGDKLILGKIFVGEHKGLLGLYAIAFFLSSAVVLALRKFATMLLLPLYARLAEGSEHSFRRNMFRIRVLLMGAAIPALCVLVIWGQPLVELLYTDQYTNVGWMLRILAAGNIFAAVTLTCASVLLAVGDSFRYMIYLLAQAILLLGGMAAGALFGPLMGWPSEVGLVIGVAAAPALSYPVLVWAVRRHGAWMPWLDLAALAGSGVVIGTGLLLTN